MQIIMEMKEYEYLKGKADKYDRVRKTIKENMNFKDCEKPLKGMAIDQNKPFTINFKELINAVEIAYAPGIDISKLPEKVDVYSIKATKENCENDLCNQFIHFMNSEAE